MEHESKTSDVLREVGGNFLREGPNGEGAPDFAATSAGAPAPAAAPKARGPVDHDQLVAEIPGLQTQFDVLRFLKRVTEKFGARAFIVLKIPDTTVRALQSVSVITTWPAELLTLYDAEDYLHASVVVRHLRKSTVPMQFDVAKMAGAVDGQKLASVAPAFIQHRMQCGAFFPVCDPAGGRGSVGFSGDREPFTSYEMMQLLMMSTHVFDRIHHISRRDQRIGEDLTQREIDCLTWTAAGKTSLEISNILNLSEHTVNHYLNRATKKLDTVNRTQAVAKALRMGIIS